jgi:hypothetical protein
MPQISKREFERLPLRAHQFLAGVPLHDVWAVDLPSPRAGITLDEFLRIANERPYTPTPVVRGLLDLRLLIGRLFGWDRPRSSTQAPPTFADRLTDADRARSLAPAGVREGPEGLFRVVYRFENEKLVELINLTVHAAALSALAETAPLLLRGLRRQRRLVDALIHGGNRSVPKTGRVPVAAAQRACELGPNDGSPGNLNSTALWRSGLT